MATDACVITITGRLGQDPDSRVLPTGQQLTKINVATNVYVGKNKDPETIWFTVEAWAGLAEFVEKNLRKGDRVFVSGPFRQEHWTAKDGAQRTSMMVRAEHLQWFPKAEGQQQAPAPQQGRPQQSTRPAPAAAVGYGALDLDDDDLPF